jgi:hypothetical protein
MRSQQTLPYPANAGMNEIPLKRVLDLNLDMSALGRKRTLSGQRETDVTADFEPWEVC